MMDLTEAELSWIRSHRNSNEVFVKLFDNASYEQDCGMIRSLGMKGIVNDTHSRDTGTHMAFELQRRELFGN